MALPNCILKPKHYISGQIFSRKMNKIFLIQEGKEDVSWCFGSS